MPSFQLRPSANFPIRGGFAWLRIAVRALIALGTLLMIAAAPADSPLKREPERYALVVGNGGYNAFGAMGDLLTSCDEAVRFRKQLIGLGWDREHIYPLVKESLGDETEQDVRKAICDLKTDRLESELKQFSNRMIASDNNPYGVVYFSGHGAQSDGNQYIFGVDADVDFAAELQRAQRAPNYKVFGDSGVDVISIVSRVSRSEGRAMLVIIDACRDNPVLKKYREDLERAKQSNKDPLLVQRLSAGYLTHDGQASDVTDDFNNIIVLFSTRPRREAAGASPGTTTPFSQFVMDQMTDTKAIQGNTPGFVDAVISEARLKQSSLPSFDRQIPDRLGSMSPSPVFCLKGCPQALDVWPSARINVITGATASFNAPLRPSRAQELGARWPMRRNIAYLRLQPQSGGPERGAARSQSLAPPPRSIKVDVFYCLGDGLASRREEEATAYARALYEAYPPSRLIGQYFVDPVRTVSFDPAANPVLAMGKVGTTIWIDQGSALERELAISFAKLGNQIVIRENKQTQTKEYISVFFCNERVRNPAPVSAIYTQVSRKADVPEASRLIAYLKTKVAGVGFIDTVDPVDEKDPSTTRTPMNSEVRYYSDDQFGSAQAIADALSERLTHAVTVKKIPLGRKPANPVIEVWIGLTETRSWKPTG